MTLSVSNQCAATRPAGCDGSFSMEKILHDPIIQAVMHADNVTAEELTVLLQRAGNAIRRRSAGVARRQDALKPHPVAALQLHDRPRFLG